MVDFTLLGTAATMPLPDRALSAAVLRCFGRTILFDCGEGTQTAARKSHISLMKTDLIALTHYHGDHIFGLPGLMQSMNCLGRTAPLYITGPGCINHELFPLIELAGYLNYEVRLISGEVRMDTVNPAWSKHAQLSSFPTKHRTASCGYVFSLDRPPRFLPEKAKKYNIPVKLWSVLQNGEAVEYGGIKITPDMVTDIPRKGLRLVFSGDTAPCEALERASGNADLLVCDATYGERSQNDLAELYGHSTFAQAAELAANAKVSRLWLTHFSQMISDPADYISNAQACFPGAEYGFDGKTVKLNFED